LSLSTDMQLALMQPYIFPYIGYFQLIQAVDTFVFYDDVNYIKNGWINRNRLRLGDTVRYFTIPLDDASPFRRINETRIDGRQPWQRKVLETIRHAYGRAPHFKPVERLVESVLTDPTDKIADMARASVLAVARYLGLTTRFVPSSEPYGNAHLHGVERVLDICRREGASRYINLPGGRSLYAPDAFAPLGLELRFLEPLPVSYRQFGERFEPWLSIIDVLMHNSPEDARQMLAQCKTSA
jgi:WbqC-like protein family